MTQILDGLPADCTDRLLCCYVNTDRKIKIARIVNISNWYFERVVFPGDWLLFEAPPEAELEVYMMRFSVVDLIEVVACDRLTVTTSQVQQDCIARYG